MTLIADPFETIEVPEAVVPAQRGPVHPASPAAIKYAVDLMVRKLGVEPEVAEAQAKALESRKVSEVIDKLKFMRDVPKAPAPGVVTEDGMYRNPTTGEIFKVQKAVHGSGNLYAKVLVELDEPVMKRGKEYRAEFEYAPGAITALRAEWKMSREEAAEFGHLYGMCCRCGATLTDEKSIERGIGPVCYGKF